MRNWRDYTLYLRQAATTTAPPGTLLKTSDKTVSEIAYEVGFGTPSYFSKCDKELFGCHPGEARYVFG